MLWISDLGWKFQFCYLLIWISVVNHQFPEKNHQFDKNFHSIWKFVSQREIQIHPHFLQIWLPCTQKTSLGFYGGYHHPTPVDMANICLKEPIQSMSSVLTIPSGLTVLFLHQSCGRKGKDAYLSYFINTDWNSKTKNHIISPTKHWGGSSKFHPPRRGSLPDPIEKNNLTLFTQLCLWGCLAQHLHQSLDTFPVSAYLQNLLGELGIPEKKVDLSAFLKIIRFGNLQQRHSEPMIHSWIYCTRGKWGKKGLEGSTKKIHWKESCGWKLWSWYVYSTYIYMYSSPTWKSLSSLERFKWLIDSTTLARWTFGWSVMLILSKRSLVIRTENVKEKKICRHRFSHRGYDTLFLSQETVGFRVAFALILLWSWWQNDSFLLGVWWLLLSVCALTTSAFKHNHIYTKNTVDASETTQKPGDHVFC